MLFDKESVVEGSAVTREGNIQLEGFLLPEHDQNSNSNESGEVVEEYAQRVFVGIPYVMSSDCLSDSDLDSSGRSNSTEAE